MNSPNQPVIDDRMFDQFRDIRKKVWFEATLGDPENQRKLREKIVRLSNEAKLDSWRTNDLEVRDQLWEEIIDKIFYSGFRAVTVQKALDDIHHTFHDYKSLCGPDWEVRLDGQQCSAGSGQLALQYLQVKDASQKKICHPMKIKKVVTVAKSFARYFDEHPQAEALSFLMQGDETRDIWLLSERLDAMGFSGQLTQLHLLMDLGFDCIKPDVVISRLVLGMGWLAHFSQELPADLKEAALNPKKDKEGKYGKYGRKFAYTKPVVFKPIVDLARQFATRMRQQEKVLEADIGWKSSNPIREFDIFMVKYGQKPDSTWGIMKQLG
jgi:hypothetical protein